MGVLSLFLAAKSDKKLSILTQICSAYSWVNVGGKFLKLLGLKRLFSEESEIKRKLQKRLGLWAKLWPAPLPDCRNRGSISITCCLQLLMPRLKAAPMLMIWIVMGLFVHGMRCERRVPRS
jgi:hypothetical protein